MMVSGDEHLISKITDTGPGLKQPSSYKTLIVLIFSLFFLLTPPLRTIQSPPPRPFAPGGGWKRGCQVAVGESAPNPEIEGLFL